MGNVLAWGNSWWIEWLLLLILESNFSSALHRSSDKEATFCAYPHLTALRRKISILLVKGVISTVPGSVWFGSVRNRSDFDASGSVNRKRVYGSVRDRSEPS